MPPSPTGNRRPTYPGLPRTRRQVLSLGLAAAVAGVVQACGGSSKKPAAATTSAAATTASTAGGVTTTAAKTAASAKPVTNPIAKGSNLAITFTCAVGESGGFGPVRNPYVAVWLEDAQGLLVRTVHVAYSQREQRYLRELRRWFVAEQGREAAGGGDLAATVSGPTRVPGEYKLAWDGLDDAGQQVGSGNYFVCIEAAREHGPYELVREQLTIGKDAFQKTLTAQGELTSANVDYKPA